MKVSRDEPLHERTIMASECSSRSGNDAATGQPQRPSPPSNVSPAGSAQETGSGTGVYRSTAAPLEREAPRHGMAASTVRALTDDDPPLPLLHVVDHEKETDGPQLHDGPPGPPSFPSELDDSLAKKLENDLERQLPDYDGASTVQSASRPDVADTSAVGPSTVEDVEEGNVSSRGATPSARSHTPAAAATPHAGLTSTSLGRSTVVIEAYRVEEDEETPGIGTVYAEVAAVPFYLRKGFVSIMIAVTLLAIGIATTTGVLLSKNVNGNTGKEITSSDDSLLPVPGQGPTNIPINLPTRSHQFATNFEVRDAIKEYLGQGCPTDANCQARSDYGGAVSPL